MPHPGWPASIPGLSARSVTSKIGVSVHAVTDQASCPLNWRLFLPRSWDNAYAKDEHESAQITRRRRLSRIPEDIGHQPKAELALEMIDELTAWGHSPPVVVADAGYGENGLFRTAVAERGLDYIMQVKASTSMHTGDAVYEIPAYSGHGRPKKPGYRTKPVQAEVLARSLPRRQYRPVSWRQGSKGTLTSRFTAVRVRPANRNLPRNPDGTLLACWLLIEWPSGATAPTDYWLSTLPEDTAIEQLVRLGKIRWRIEHDYRELKHGLGLDHFSGAQLVGLASPHSVSDRGASVCHYPTLGRGPKSVQGGVSFYVTLAELQTAVIRMLAYCPYCGRAPT